MMTTFISKDVHFKMSSLKCRRFWAGFKPLNVFVLGMQLLMKDVFVVGYCRENTHDPIIHTLQSTSHVGFEQRWISIAISSTSVDNSLIQWSKHWSGIMENLIHRPMGVNMAMTSRANIAGYNICIMQNIYFIGVDICCTNKQIPGCFQISQKLQR